VSGAEGFGRLWLVVPEDPAIDRRQQLRAVEWADVALYRDQPNAPAYQ
jgi:hypothetical protein